MTPPDGFDRRAFLLKVAIGGGVAWAAPTVTTIGLSRATATPCPAGVTEQQATEITAAEAGARSARTHTPCYQRCMEERARREVEAAAAFDAGMIEAGSDEARRAECAEQYRARLADSATQFKGCTGGCG